MWRSPFVTHSLAWVSYVTGFLSSVNQTQHWGWQLRGQHISSVCVGTWLLHLPAACSSLWRLGVPNPSAEILAPIHRGIGQGWIHFEEELVEISNRQAGSCSGCLRKWLSWPGQPHPWISQHGVTAREFRRGNSSSGKQSRQSISLSLTASTPLLSCTQAVLFFQNLSTEVGVVSLDKNHRNSWWQPCLVPLGPMDWCPL